MRVNALRHECSLIFNFDHLDLNFVFINLYFDNFDPQKSSNPFAYFTQIIYYAFLRRIQKEKKQLYVKYKATEQFGILDENELLGFEEATGRQFEMYDNISEFIETFEENREKKKKVKVKGIDKFVEMDDIKEV